MYFLTFIVFLPLFLISAAIFIAGLVLLARDSARARDVLTTGLGFGLVSVFIAAMVFIFS